MSRDEMKFDIYYNEYMEKYLCTFWGRIDKIIIFFQIFLGTMVFADVSVAPAYGAIIAILSVFSVVYTPAKKSYDADNQCMRYVRLRIHEKDMTDDELRAEFLEANEHDSDPLGSLSAPSYLRASIKLALETKDIPRLTGIQKCFAWLGGDLPKT